MWSIASRTLSQINGGKDQVVHVNRLKPCRGRPERLQTISENTEAGSDLHTSTADDCDQLCHEAETLERLTMAPRGLRQEERGRNDELVQGNAEFHLDEELDEGQGEDFRQTLRHVSEATQPTESQLDYDAEIYPETEPENDQEIYPVETAE